MINKEPPKPSLILATPVNVEESRAKRHQRQQSRFRDRGGIFVPTSRSTLADILLGKAPPLKKPARRSISASPTKRKAHASHGPAQDLVLTARHAISRKSSPRKQKRKSSAEKVDKNTLAPSVEATKDSDPKVLKNSQVRTSSKSKSILKSFSKNTETTDSGPSMREEVAQHVSSKFIENTETAAAPKSAPKGRATKAAATSAKPKKSQNQNSGISSKSKGKAKARPNAKTEISETDTENAATVTKTKSLSVHSQSSNAVPISAVVEPYKPLLSKRRKSTLYSDGFSEDEYIPKQVKRAKSRMKIAVGSKEKASKGSISSKQSNKVPRKLPNRNKTDAPQLPDIPEGDEADISDEKSSNESPPVLEQPDAPCVKNSNKSSKRSVQETELDPEQPQRPKKRAKTIENEDEAMRPGKAKTKTQKKPSRKRSRTENAIHEPNEEPKKVIEQSEPKAEPKSKPTKLTKPTKPKSQKSTDADRKRSSSEEKKSSKRKRENATVPERVQRPAAAPLRKGPPKRVLQRLMECQHHDVDNEPDPIDFLS
ncbi:hypothetical protein CPB84DRAFT_1847040 [Gymnopilus junonius]|uniref:Uncharacterized protein n=1 Tax=Gymnopilus junonius TaxID=109634 RepID=A0A9P5NNA1_GYMJU|nr:hypothetical protein CPB84DRAFT_1847040 [Gymnopilus junonius]